MGKPREISRMLSVSDGYWGFIHKKRFYRYVYASLTIFATFALVASFFTVGAGTAFASDYITQKLHLTNAQMEENARMLQWIYAFYPTPLACAWFIVYFGKFLFCWRIKRLRKARNYKYNLLLATIVMAVVYAVIFKFALKLDVIDGPKFRVALILLVCEFSLIGIEVFDMQQARHARHERKRLLQKQREAEASIRRQVQSDKVFEERVRAPPSPRPFPEPGDQRHGLLV